MEKGYKELKDMPIDRFLIEYDSKNKLKEYKEILKRNKELEHRIENNGRGIIILIFISWFWGFVIGYVISSLF